MNDAHNYIKKYKQEKRQRAFRKIGTAVVEFVILSAIFVEMLMAIIILN